MFSFLTSLQNLLISWANSDAGARTLASQPRNPTLAAHFESIKSTGKKVTGTTPNSDVLGATILSLLN